MNLNYPYDRASLNAFSLIVKGKLQVHNLVVDFDGEVLLDPELCFPNVPLTKYKFYTLIDDKRLRDAVSLASLYDALDEIFTNKDFAARKHPGSRNPGKIAA